MVEVDVLRLAEAHEREEVADADEKSRNNVPMSGAAEEKLCVEKRFSWNGFITNSVELTGYIGS